ncbi:MAG: response regulator [Thermoguttaceae bacterium]|jgi:DNA-binding response OmpR family regulator/glycine cleavage system H lipoate-binding protein
MADDRTLLVVDDEEVVCQACRRIFTRQGFEVEVNTDARQGLALATEKDYSIILLDIKMPNIDGIEFLERLREHKPSVPVLIITGYPSIPNASAAMRLGACDYVTKPFTTEEITWAVQRVLSTKQMLSPECEAPELSDEALATESAAAPLFWDESWARMEIDGSACVGAVVPGIRGASITAVRLPRIGEVVYQGLPLAGVAVSGKPMVLIPSPVSGVVMAVNELLTQRPGLLASDPCGEGQIACICTTRHDEEGNCKPRRVLLVNADPASSQQQAEKLAALGCQVDQVSDRDGLLAALADGDGRAVFFDATSLGDAGPGLVEQVNRRAPHVRVVVVGAAGGAGETAYRKHKIFYYAVEPFSDNEIADILAAVFQTREIEPPESQHKKGPPEPISGISITNRNLHKVQLLAAPGLLWAHEGLGAQLSKKLLAQMFPVVVTPGEAYLTPANILKTAAACNRVMVLLARDSGLLPGSLARDTKPEFDIDPGEAAGRVTILAVQPDALGGFASLDARTITALADHIVWDMASY